MPKRQLWDDDSIQFPRLLAEIQATIELTKEQTHELCVSMDIDRDELFNLFERAQEAWQRIKYGTLREGLT